MKTDYDKFCWVLGEIGCKNTKYTTRKEKSIEINSSHIKTYGGLNICFDIDGKFIGFETCE